MLATKQLHNYELKTNPSIPIEHTNNNNKYRVNNLTLILRKLDYTLPKMTTGHPMRATP